MRPDVTFSCAVTATAAALFAGAASADFVVIDTFESYAAGDDVAGQPGWTGSTVYDVVVDPNDPDNLAMSVSGPDGAEIYYSSGTTIQIPDGGTGTLFLRFMASVPDQNGVGFQFGLSDSATPSNFGAFEAQVGIIGTGDAGLEGRSGGGSPDVNETIADDVWYNLWIVADNTTDTMNLYLQGGAYATQTQLTYNAGSTDWNFRNGTTDALVSLLFRVGNSNDDGTTYFFDDIYVDNTGENLSNPIPEPASLALMGLGGLMVLRRRTV